MHSVVYGLAAALYAGASLRYVTWFAQARSGTPRWGLVLVYGGALLHALAVVVYWWRFGEPPLVGLGPSLASLSLLVGLAVIVVSFVASARAVGLLLAPMAALLLGLGLIFGLQPTGAAPAFRVPWLALHTSLAFLGYVGWMVAAAAAAMYLAQFRELKRKRLGAVFQFFPDLDTLDRLSEGSLVAALVSLTLGILVGGAWVLRFDPGLSWGDAKVVWGLLSWVVLGLVVWKRLNGQGTGREAARWNLIGLGLIAVVYVVMKLMSPGTRFFL